MHVTLHLCLGPEPDSSRQVPQRRVRPMQSRPGAPGCSSRGHAKSLFVIYVTCGSQKFPDLDSGHTCASLAGSRRRPNRSPGHPGVKVAESDPHSGTCCDREAPPSQKGAGIPPQPSPVPQSVAVPKDACPTEEGWVIAAPTTRRNPSPKGTEAPSTLSHGSMERAAAAHCHFPP